MNKQTLMCCGLLLASTQTAAVTIDVRHEWLDDSKAHKDRIAVSHRFDNGIGFGLEAKWRSGGDNKNKAFRDMVSNGTESTLNYQYRPIKEWFVQPGFTLESSEERSIYKPFLMTGYAFANGIYINGRYRYEYTRESETDKEDMKTNRGEIWLGYDFTDWKVEYNYIYKHSDQIRFNNKKWDYEQNIKALWKFNKSWAPYIEVGDISVRKTTDERQTRLRIGLQYKF
ncbi:oligogalacturonate-specific porin KdgM family protein [Pantoea sp. FN0302]|uniref:oligogalacturonate-specific porin KdgM family protein n=1 Tax=unclassified Pantoea TaxID=2630326 RepID=UPI003CEFBD84